MKLEDLPIGAIDWSCIPAVVYAGENGTAAARSRILGGITLRVVAYSGGYMADHWCAKGHILHVISGSLVIEHEDETRTTVSTGMSWHAPDGAVAHRVLCDSGATVLIID